MYIFTLEKRKRVIPARFWVGTILISFSWTGYNNGISFINRPIEWVLWSFLFLKYAEMFFLFPLFFYYFYSTKISYGCMPIKLCEQPYKNVLVFYIFLSRFYPAVRMCLLAVFFAFNRVYVFCDESWTFSAFFNTEYIFLHSFVLSPSIFGRKKLNRTEISALKFWSIFVRHFYQRSYTTS